MSLLQMITYYLGVFDDLMNLGILRAAKGSADGAGNQAT